MDRYSIDSLNVMSALKSDEIVIIVGGITTLELEFDLASRDLKKAVSYKWEVDWFYNQEVIQTAIENSIKQRNAYHCDINNH